MPTSRIFSRNLDLKGYQVKNFVFNPMTTSARTALSLTTDDEGYAVFDTDANSPYYWDGTQWITWPGGGGGSGNAINITYTAFQALTGGSTTIPYYITDVGKEGFFYYTGTVADQTSDNGGTIIVTADLKQYRRSYTGDLQVTWFGALTGSGNATATTAAIIAARNAAVSNQRLYLGAGDWYINSTITFTNTSTKRNHIYIQGNVFSTHSGDAFILEGNFTGSFVCKGKITGPNPSATDEAGYSAYVGSGVRMRNLYQNYIEVNEVVRFREGLHCTGEGTGTPFNGSQYNVIRFNFLYENYMQIKISTYGAPTSAGNFANECFWYGGQLGRGVPYVDYGKNGWYGLVAVKDASNPVSPGAYGIGGHMFHHMNFEGLEHGAVLDNCTFMKFLGCSWEEGGMHFHISLSESYCESTAFDSNCVVHDRFFVTGRKGLRTTVDSPYWNADPLNPSVQVPVGNTATSQVSIGSSSFLVSSDIYMGFTAWNLAGPDLWSKKSQFPTVTAGQCRYNGVIRHFAYKGTYDNIDASRTDDIITLKPNIAYVRYNPNEPKTLIINAEDLATSNFWQSFEIEVLSTQPLTIQRGDTSATIFSPTDFPTTGRYKIDYRSNGFVKIRIDGGSSGGSIVPAAIGSTPNANALSYNSTTGAFNLQPASAAFGGVLTTTAQEIAGVKTLKDNLILNKATPASLTLETTSATESDEAAFNVNTVTAGTALRISNSSTLQLGRKDNTVSSTVTFANGKTFGSGRQWSLGLRAGNNDFSLYNDAGTAAALTIIGSNNNIRIGSTATDPGVKLQVDGAVKVNADSLFLGILTSDPGTPSNGQMYYNSTLGKFRGYEAGSWKDIISTGGGGGGGITTLNTLTGTTQTFATGNSGTDFNISSSGTAHTFNIPSASAGNRGLITTGTQTIGSTAAHTKTFNGTVLLGRVGDTAANSAPLKFNAGLNLMNVPEVNSVEYYDNSLWLTNTLASRSKILTGDNVAVLTNKTWNAVIIEPAYLRETDGTTVGGILNLSTQSIGGPKTFLRTLSVTGAASDKVKLSLSGNISSVTEPGSTGVGLVASSFTYNDAGAARTISNHQTLHYLAPPTLSSSAAVTYAPDAEVPTLRVKFPLAGTNTTIPNPIAIRAEYSKFDAIGLETSEQGGNVSMNRAQSFYVAMGGTTATYTLPSRQANEGMVFIIRNANSGNITLNSATNEMWTTTTTSTTTIAPNNTVIVVAGNNYWYVMPL